MSRPEDPRPGYEHSDMNPAMVGMAAVGLLVLLALALLGVTLFEQVTVGLPLTISRPADLVGGLQAAPAPTPPMPALEAQAGQSFSHYRAFEEQRLTSYGWVDRTTGVIRIPIDRAMDLTAERSLPSRATPAARSTSPSVASSGRVEEAYP